MESPPNPQLWLLAGGNGAGKSTYYERFLKPGGLIFVNADLVAREINPSDPERVSYDAAQKVEAIRLGYLGTIREFRLRDGFFPPVKDRLRRQSQGAGLFDRACLYSPCVHRTQSGQGESAGGARRPLRSAR